MINIIIFGGRIGGLTVAHELVIKGFNVTIVEQDDILGGMARSRREEYSIPSEHSWRGYVPDYIVIGYLLVKYLSSDLRREEYFTPLHI